MVDYYGSTTNKGGNKNMKGHAGLLRPLGVALGLAQSACRAMLTPRRLQLSGQHHGVPATQFGAIRRNGGGGCGGASKAALNCN